MKRGSEFFSQTKIRLRVHGRNVTTTLDTHWVSLPEFYDMYKLYQDKLYLEYPKSSYAMIQMCFPRLARGHNIDLSEQNEAYKCLVLLHMDRRAHVLSEENDLTRAFQEWRRDRLPHLIVEIANVWSFAVVKKSSHLCFTSMPYKISDYANMAAYFYTSGQRTRADFVALLGLFMTRSNVSRVKYNSLLSINADDITFKNSCFVKDHDTWLHLTDFCVFVKANYHIMYRGIYFDPDDPNRIVLSTRKLERTIGLLLRHMTWPRSDLRDRFCHNFIFSVLSGGNRDIHLELVPRGDLQ